MIFKNFLFPGVGVWIWCKYCVHKYVNGKMVSVETAPGIGGEGGWNRIVEGVNSSMI
jgi:hypothetical protein